MSEQQVQDENNVNIEQNSMVQRIALEAKRREPSTIHELVLDNCARCHSIQGLTEDFCNLRTLSIINVGLQSLAKFPALPKLRKLHLSDNRLSSGLENLESCPNLSVLILAGNKFKSIDELKPLVKLPKLSTLDLMNCEVTSADGYRETMFNMLPQLKYLDNIDKEGVERDSDDEDEDEDDDEDAEENGDDDDEENDDEDEYEEDDNKTSLKALYNGTFEEGDDDEESYEGNEEDEESDEDDDLSEGDVSADPIEEAPKGEKRKRDTDDQEDKDDDGPPTKI